MTDILANLSPESRVWIYMSSQEFTKVQSNQIQAQIDTFVQDWSSHQKQLFAGGALLHQRFVVLMVDENQAGASGCSIDKSVYFIKDLAQQFQVDFFDRLNFAFIDQDQIKTAKREEFAQLFKEGKINEDTLVFNNLVQTKKDFESMWKIPLKDSFHKNMV